MQRVADVTSPTSTIVKMTDSSGVNREGERGERERGREGEREGG
jgi:hypothetical protein